MKGVIGVIPGPDLTFNRDHIWGRFLCNIRDYKAGYSLGSTKSPSVLHEIL